MRLHIVAVGVLFAILSSGCAQAGTVSEEESFGTLRQALVYVYTNCAYDVSVSNKNIAIPTPLDEKIVNQGGNGALIDMGPKDDNTYVVLTASLLTNCLYHFSPEHGLRDGDEISVHLARRQILVVYNAMTYEAQLIDQHGEVSADESNYALLQVKLPSDFHPMVLPMLPSRTSPKYREGSSVVVMGEIAKSEIDFVMFSQQATIQEIHETSFSVSATSFDGVIGSPVLWWNGKKYQVIGFVEAGFRVNQQLIPFTAVITMYKDMFFKK